MNYNEQVFNPILHCLNLRAGYVKTTPDWEWVIGDPVVSSFVQALYLMGQTGIIHLSDRIRAHTHHEYFWTAANWLKREVCLKPILARLDQAGIDAIPLKGADFIHTIYPKTGLRSSGDIDFLVRPEHFLRSAEILLGTDLQPMWDPVNGDLFYFRKVPQSYWPSALGFIDQQGFSIDLHRHLVNDSWFQPAFPVQMDEIWQRSIRSTTKNYTPWQVRLSPYDRLAHLCLHLATDGLHVLKNFFNVDQCLRNLPEGWDWAYYLEIAAAWQIKSVSFHVFKFCLFSFETPIPDGILKALAPSRFAQWQLRALISPQAILSDRLRLGSRHHGLITFTLCDGIKAKWRFLHRLFLPEKAWLENYHGYNTLPAHWQSLLKMIKPFKAVNS